VGGRAGGAYSGVVRQEMERLAGLMAAGGVAVLSGAGLSTESGIPDYRGETGQARRGTPMTYEIFTGDPQARKRYWARSQAGWRMFAKAAPNQGHLAVAQLQKAGIISGVVTQNVDGLHSAAGAPGVIELHGNLDRVVCLTCGDLSHRAEMDRRLREANPGFDPEVIAFNPDGDALLSDVDIEGFHTVDCTVCRRGVLKPDVVFFGETVPPGRVQESFAIVERARLLLVLGSSLQVMSGRRFVIRAVKHGLPVAIVNQGPTRGDDRATVVIDAPLGQVLPRLAEDLT
jgi:NAD-dependent SIR2 family protein deacetylase